MKIAIDVSPLQTDHKLRGVGFYLEHIKNAFLKYYPENNYVFFVRGEKLSEDIDLVHFPYFEPFFLARPIYNKFKTAVTVHDLTPIVFPKAFPRGIKGELKWQMQKYSLRQADVIITDSESSKKDIVKHVGIDPSNINVVYLAAGEEFRQLTEGKWEIDIRKKYNLPKKFTLYVGDVTWNKNLPRLINAVKEAKIPLVMVGKSLVSENYDKNNSWNSDLNKIHELLKGDKNIIRLGFVSMPELVEIYNLATVFVMPSLYEGFGLPILEAMSCGTPVVTTEEGSLKEVAGEGALYVDGYDIHSIASGIKKVFSDEKLQKELSKKGLENVKKFSWKKTAEQTLSVYRQCLDNK